MEDLAPAVGPGTMILPVLNGMRHIDRLRERFGAKSVAGCVCKIAATLDDQGRIAHLAPFHDLIYGEMDGRPSDRMAALDAFMGGAGFDATLSPTIERQMWEKWILLAALGAIGCLMRGTVGEVEAVRGGTQLVVALLDEVVAIVRAAGTPPSDAFLVAARAQLTAKGSSFTSSMYRDMRKGLRLEADQILGDLLLRGEQAGITAPLLGAAYANLAVHQARL